MSVGWILGCHSRRIYYFSGMLFRNVGNICKIGCNFVWASRPESPTRLSCGNCTNYIAKVSLDSGNTVIDFENFLVSNLLLNMGSHMYLLFCVSR